ncbi:unnamed protein product [Adineta steineri]|uniref:F-box domain-containing protein n=3 Tax=Adineta steineri TaxID=433720 RepID=A0A814MM45_9BILA|nr:unnamed protein product [Adineta steineri]CAF3647068.1 unnamed protein product [Adineta steineri]
MTQSDIGLIDLPVEILYYIFNKLDNVDVLYSLFGINNLRIASIIGDQIFSNTLNLTRIIDNTLIFNRFCNSIIPQIRSNVQCLTVDFLSIEHIHYPNLNHLKFINFQRDNCLHHFTDQSSADYILRNQITKLELSNIDHERKIGTLARYTETVYVHILNYFQQLKYFAVPKTTTYGYPSLSLCRLPSNTFSSRTLTYLSIHVSTFADCLCLLDGRLKQLNTFIVTAYSMNTNQPVVHNSDDLSNMKYFSFIYCGLIEEFDDKIISLLRRMLNLKKLTLYLRIKSQNHFLDPTSLINEYSMDMKQLQSFDYYISTENNQKDYSHHLSNNNVKQKYLNMNREVTNIISTGFNTVTYHVFTVPFKFATLKNIGNIFPNIIFNNVIELWIHDVIPFEHEFFLRIAKLFPLLKSLFVNDYAPSSYASNQSSHEIHSNTIARYPHLSSLSIINTGTRYIEQFLNENKTNLPCLTSLRVFYQYLRIVTEDFTREATRHNCVNIKQLTIYSYIVGSKDFHNYFPLLNT